MSHTKLKKTSPMRDSVETCTILTPFPYALRESFLRVGLWNNSQPTPILPLSFSIAISISSSLSTSVLISVSISFSISQYIEPVYHCPNTTWAGSQGKHRIQSGITPPLLPCCPHVVLLEWTSAPFPHIQLPPVEVMIHSLLLYPVSAAPSLTDSWLHLPRSSDVCTSSWIVPCVYLDVRMSCRSYKT